MGPFLWVTADHLRCWDSQAKLAQLQLHVGTCPWWPEQDYLQTPLQPGGASAAGPGLLKALTSLLFGPPGNSKNRINLTNEQSTFCLCQLIHLQWQQLPLLLLRKLSHTWEWSLCSEYSFFLFQKTQFFVFMCHFKHNPLVGYYHAWVCYHCFLSPGASQWFPGFAKPGEHSPSDPHLSWSKMHNSPDRWVLQLKWAIKSISIVCFISKSSSSETLSSWTCLDQLSIS